MKNNRIYRTYGLTDKEIKMLSEMSKHESVSMSAIVRKSIVSQYKKFKRKQKNEKFDL